MSSLMTIIEDDFDFTSTHHWVLENDKLTDLKYHGSEEQEDEDAIERMLKVREGNGANSVDFKFGFNIDDHHFRLLIDTLCNRSVDLQHLEITFLHLNELTSYAIDYLSQAFQSNQFSNLKSLSLNFLWLNADNDTLISLTKAISEGAPDLENLVLKFNHLEQAFSDASVYNLCKHISEGLVNLESLELSLSYGRKSEDISSQNMEEHIGLNLPNLNKLKLDLHQVADTDIELLAKIFQNRPINLENIDLHLNSCESVTPLAVRSLIESFDEGASSFKDVKIVLSKSVISSEEQKSLQQLVKRLFRRDFSLEFIFSDSN